MFKYNLFFAWSSVLSVCDQEIKIQSWHRWLRPLPGVWLLKVPGANVSHDSGFVTTTQRALFLLLGCFFGLIKVCVQRLAFSGETLRPPDLGHLWVSGGAPPPLGNRPAALRRLAHASSLRVRLAGGAPPFPAFLPPLLPLGFVVGRAGAFPLLLVRARAAAALLLLGGRRARVIPRADLDH